MSTTVKDLGTCSTCDAPLQIIFIDDFAQAYCDECGEVAQ